MSVNISIKLMIFLWKIGVVDGFTLTQFILNGAAQYGVFVVGSAVGQTLDPSILVAPIAQLGTAYQYVRAAQGAAEAQKRAATIAVLLSSSTAVLETDLATNGAMAALNLAFNAYMNSVLEAANGGNIPFLLTYKAGQHKIIILFIVGGVVLVLIYYYIKLLIMAARKGWRITRSSNFHHKLDQFVCSTHQRLVVDSS